MPMLLGRTWQNLAELGIALRRYRMCEAILGISRASGPDEIKKAYRAKALKWLGVVLLLVHCWKVAVLPGIWPSKSEPSSFWFGWRWLVHFHCQENCATPRYHPDKVGRSKRNTLLNTAVFGEEVATCGNHAHMCLSSLSENRAPPNLSS